MTEHMTTIPDGIEIVAERTQGARTWVPEVRGQTVYWPEMRSGSSGSSDILSKVLRELTPAEHDELKGKMAEWAQACLTMAQEHAKHLAGARSLDEAVEDEYQDDPKAISDCTVLAAHLYRASRDEDDPRSHRW
jgi:hypothetical protein